MQYRGTKELTLTTEPKNTLDCGWICFSSTPWNKKSQWHNYEPNKGGYLTCINKTETQYQDLGRSETSGYQWFNSTSTMDQALPGSTGWVQSDLYNISGKWKHNPIGGKSQGIKQQVNARYLL